jgi:pyruvate dehydrogenase E2 component (dihydrolipoamide acetyltransferase)
MITQVKLPKLGETMEDGIIVGFTAKLGHEVKKGDVIFEVETDKATLEVESPASGFVKYLAARIGQKLSVGDTVLILADKGENVPKNLLFSSNSKMDSKKTDAAPKTDVTSIDTSEILESVQSAQTGQKIKLGAVIPLNRLQKITAQRMLQSKREIPCFYLTVRADVTSMVEFRADLNKKSNVKTSYNDFIMRAVAIGLKKFPIMTGVVDGEAIKLADRINIGLAVSLPNGLVVPVVRDVDKKDVTAIALDSNSLIEKAFNNKLSLADLEGACITISNLGSFRIDSFIPIVVPGQCSILGIGQIADTCVADDSKITTRKLMSMTLSVDHKVASGAYASEFLDFVRKTLEDASNFR